jgi:hypothetical protein
MVAFETALLDSVEDTDILHKGQTASRLGTVSFNSFEALHQTSTF